MMGNELVVVTEMVRAYKVVRQGSDGSLLSSSVLPIRYETTYKPKRWTLPRASGTGLFVFEHESQARDHIRFYDYLDTHELWVCLADGIVEVSKIAYYDHITRFWARESLDGSQTFKISGAFVTPRVKLVERVKL